MAFKGVRSSWLMLARNCDLCRLATSSSRLFASISRKSRAFWIARTDWVAKVWRRFTTSGAKAPASPPPPHRLGFFDRSSQLAGPCLQFLEEADVLDGDDRLVGEGFDQLDLLFRELTDPCPADRDGPDGHSFTQEWSHELGSVSRYLHAGLEVQI